MKHTYRKPLGAVAGGLALMLALSSCGLDDSSSGAEGSEGGSLTIYTARDKGLAEAVVADFEAANPDYAGKVEILTLGAQEALERIRAEKANPQGDIWWGGTGQQMKQAAGDDILAPAPEAVIDAVPEDLRDPSGLWVGEMQLAEVIFYNHDMLSEEEAPKDWDDLVAPEMADKLAIRDVEASGTMRSIYSAMIDRQYDAAGSPEAGYDWLRQLDANTKVYAANPTDLYLRVTRQEAAASAWNLQDVMLQIESQNAPYTPVIPESGAPMLVDGVAKIKNGPSSEAADAFLEFLFSEETQKDLSETYYQIPSIEMAETPAWLSELDLVEMDVNWDRIGENESEWIGYWAENIKGKG